VADDRPLEVVNKTRREVCHRSVTAATLIRPVVGLVVARPLTTVLGRCKAEASQDRAEEVVNSLTHGAGLALSLAGAYALAVIAAGGGPRRVIGCDVYGTSLVLQYAASTLCHGWPAGRVKRTFLLIDQVGIYVLIAGTATPLALLAPPGVSGAAFLAVAWASALAGILTDIARARRPGAAALLPYLGVCGACLAASRPVVAALPRGEALWLLAGGSLYAAGLAFFLSGGRRFHHAIWHAFVLGGSLCHFQMVLGRLTAAG
jgi:hemolysin III